MRMISASKDEKSSDFGGLQSSRKASFGVLKIENVDDNQNVEEYKGNDNVIPHSKLVIQVDDNSLGSTWPMNQAMKQQIKESRQKVIQKSPMS